MIGEPNGCSPESKWHCPTKSDQASSPPQLTFSPQATVYKKSVELIYYGTNVWNSQISRWLPDTRDEPDFCHRRLQTIQVVGCCPMIGPKKWVKSSVVENVWFICDFKVWNFWNFKEANFYVQMFIAVKFWNSSLLKCWILLFVLQSNE